MAIAQLLNKKFTISLELPYLKKSIILFIYILMDNSRINTYSYQIYLLILKN